MSPLRPPLRRAAVTVAAVATAPYLVLKVLWLTGSTAGTTSDAGAEEMTDPRFVVGNVVTVLLVLAAIAFAVGLTRPWARRIPAWLVLVLGAGATGLLAPILLGLPVGLAVNLVVEGSVEVSADAGLARWVFALVYGGFGLLALALAVLVAAYVVERWGHLMARPPRRPSPLVTLAGALGLLPFGVAMTWWGAGGPGGTGPDGMDLPAQRTVLVVTGVLAVSAFVVPLVGGRLRRRPRGAWLVTWTGCCTAVLQAPTQVLLAQGGEVRPAVALVAVPAVPGAAAYGLAVLRRRLAATGGAAHALAGDRQAEEPSARGG